MELQKTNILGIDVSMVDMAETLTIIDEWITDKKKHYICVRDTHGIVRSQNDAELLQIHHKAGLVIPDGIPLVWIGKLRGFSNIERVCGPDLMPEVCKLGGKKYRHFFYGGAKEVPEILATALQKRFPKMNVVGTYSPPFRELTHDEDERIINLINQANPDIVWVGMSTPRQEYWMSKHVDQLNASVLLGVGAAFDLHAGLIKRAPLWMQRNGLEWLFRIMMDPRRLLKRYLYIIPKFIFLMLLDTVQYFWHFLRSKPII